MDYLAGDAFLSRQGAGHFANPGATLILILPPDDERERACTTSARQGWPECSTLSQSRACAVHSGTELLSPCFQSGMDIILHSMHMYMCPSTRPDTAPLEIGIHPRYPTYPRTRPSRLHFHHGHHLHPPRSKFRHIYTFSLMTARTVLIPHAPREQAPRSLSHDLEGCAMPVSTVCIHSAPPLASLWLKSWFPL